MAQQQWRAVTQLPSTQAYDRWAATYDTDGNILQSLDSHGLSTVLLPRLLHHLAASSNGPSMSLKQSKTLRIVDLGCGTGRATLALLGFLRQASDNEDAAAAVVEVFTGSKTGEGNEASAALHITGLDASRGMLDVAQARVPQSRTIHLRESLPGGRSRGIIVAVSTKFHQCDVLSADDENFAGPSAFGPADVVICSLVIEHFPSLNTFFRNLAKRLRLDGGFVLLTNMHPDMAGGATQATDSTPVATARADADAGSVAINIPNVTGAGFTDPVTGGKIRVAESYAHSIEDVVAAAKTAGFEVIDGVEEMAVKQWMIEQGIVNVERGKKWAAGRVKCWFGMVLKLGRP